MLHRPLPRIFCLNTSKGFASNPQFLLLTLKLQFVCTERYFVAHMFTSCHCVADVVPPEKRESERCQARVGESKIIRYANVGMEC